MEIAEFEEKQYETGLLWELAGSSPFFFSSGQALEAILGYDFALSPGDSGIWDLLDAGFPPGVMLTPSLWPTGSQPPNARLPPFLVSLIVQAKRPQWLDHWKAGQNHYWHGPYFRFYLRTRQQRTLEQLEGRVADKALVRYAAAAFIEYSTLVRYQRARALASHSTFVSPLSLQGHRLWSYSGAGTHGYANPEGFEVSADTSETLIRRARSLATRRSLPDHVGDLASTVEPVPDLEGDWLRLVAETLQLGDSQVEALAAWSRFANAMATTGSARLILGFDSSI